MIDLPGPPPSAFKRLLVGAANSYLLVCATVGAVFTVAYFTGPVPEADAPLIWLPVVALGGYAWYFGSGAAEAQGREARRKEPRQVVATFTCAVCGVPVGHRLAPRGGSQKPEVLWLPNIGRSVRDSASPSWRCIDHQAPPSTPAA